MKECTMNYSTMNYSTMKYSTMNYSTMNYSTEASIFVSGARPKLNATHACRYSITESMDTHVMLQQQK